MIFTSTKKKTAKAIQISTMNALTDGILAKECGDITSNELAAAYLCTEVVLQRIYFLVFVINRKFHGKYDWATLDFVTTNIGQGILKGMGNQDLFPIIMNGLNRLMKIEGYGPDRMQKVYYSSAQIILEHDRHLNQDDLIKFIEKNVQSFRMVL
jgi:hypothetical protein